MGLQELSTNFHDLKQKKITKLFLRRTFVVRRFCVEKVRDMCGDWKSPAMSTHMCGCKFCVGVDAKGCDQDMENVFLLICGPCHENLMTS